MTRKKLFLVDGSSYIFRAYHATERQRLSTSKGLPTNASYVLTNMLQKLIKEEKPDYLVVIWDAPGKTFREEKYEDYKATRKETPKDLLPQFDYIRAIIDAFQIATIEKQGYEADDVIATIAEKLKSKPELEIVIVSGDKDMAQALADNVKILDTMKNKITTRETIKEKYGVNTEQLVDLFALMGDTSDNIPGVMGIGEKTASKLIQEFGGLDQLYQNLDKVPEKIREKLIAHKDKAYLSRDLVKLVSDLEIEFELENFKLKEPAPEKLLPLLRELEFHKLLEDYSQESSKIDKASYQLVLKTEQLKSLVEELKKKKAFAFDLESTSEDPMQAEPVGFSFALEPGKAFYLPFSHKLKLGEAQLDKELVFKELKPILESEQYQKIGQNLKYDFMVLHLAGIELAGIHFDTMLGSYLLNPRRRTHNLKELALEHLGHKMISFEEVAGKGKSQRLFSEVELESACLYSAEDADIAYRLYQKFLNLLKEQDLEKLYYELELPLLLVLARMEISGVKVDERRLKQISQELREKEELLKQEIFELAKGEFNIDSPRQLGEVLFERLSLPRKKKTKTGYSTSFEVLKELAILHPLPAKIVEYRTLSKLRSTYTDALIKLINPLTRRLHTSYNQTITATGRLSSSEPNLQNIPARTPEGRKIREAFIAEDGYKMISADYSQIELRILAHFSGEPALIKAFERGEDIHKRTAMEVFGIPPEQVNEELRRKAKVINFGVLYGMSDFGLAQELGIDQKQAKKYIERYFIRYPKVKEFLERVLKEAREKLYIKTILGRRCYFPDINSENQIVRKSAEREAINAPMQGSAADIIKRAMVRIDQEMRKKNLESKMMLQVHDELVFEAKEEEIEELKKIIIKEMENVHPLKVPLKVEVGIGDNWLSAH